MSYLLGIDLGSSSVKVALVDAESGQCVASASYPDTEAPIKALQPGWAEQRPDDWWQYFKTALKRTMAAVGASGTDISAIGISYQMHGLVCLDKDLRPLRDAIIWCDSRGVPYGQRAFDTLGHDFCLAHLLNSPGNFTVSKLAWVKDNEPALFDKIKYIMLPGDYLALRLTGTAATTVCGLSEMMLWDYSAENGLATFLMDYFGFPKEIIPPLVSTFGEQGRLSASAAGELGLKAGIPVSYRAGDQPNNALSLAVLNPGEVAATAGTSGVVYGIGERLKVKGERSADAGESSHLSPLTSHLSPINTFLHVNHRLGVMHCVNGCGILNAWIRRNVAADMSYNEMNSLAATVPVGSDGVSIIPFGNGAERVLGNRNIGCSVHGIDFNRHTRSHLLRAAQEGIVFALYYGMEIMQGERLEVRGGRLADADEDTRLSPFTSHLSPFTSIHAGNANMFLSPLFREALASISGATIELYDTDGAAGAARGAGLGSGLYASPTEAFASLHRISITEPSDPAPYREAYHRWKESLR